jgi:hypothetical protein
VIDERRHREERVPRIQHTDDVPQHVPVRSAQGEHVTVRRAHEEDAVLDRDTAIDAKAKTAPWYAKRHRSTPVSASTA